MSPLQLEMAFMALWVLGAISVLLTIWALRVESRWWVLIIASTAIPIWGFFALARWLVA